MDRRNFLKTATVAAAGSVPPASVQSAPSTDAARRAESPNMIYRELGRTSERVSAIGMGGYHIGKQQNPDESVRLVRAAIDRGITFMDNCWDYQRGPDGPGTPRGVQTKGSPDDEDRWQG